MKFAIKKTIRVPKPYFELVFTSGNMKNLTSIVRKAKMTEIRKLE
jgi:hypothetical protein